MPQARQRFDSLTSKNSSERKHVKGAPMTAIRIAQSGVVPFNTLGALHRGQMSGGTTERRAG
jgi:hypothetical protein